MSTRRARIKAVTSLPPRRKNNNNADKGKAAIVPKDEFENTIKSPKTPRSSVKHQETIRNNSPKPKPESPLKSPRGVNNAINSLLTRVPSPAVVKEAVKETSVTPKVSEKVSVITSTSSIRPTFISPKSIGSPVRKPAPPTPKQITVESYVQKLNSPEKVPASPIIKSIVDKTPILDKSKEAAASNVATEARSDVPDDYNVPSVPESVTEDGMDGIVPLQPVATAPKPIALLKNEIISENAEVLFDPIVPLPSPSKVRPKLRPVPRLNPIRRNSIQGSASESEDESRRALLNAGPATPAPSRQRTESHTSLSTLVSLPNRDVTRVRNDSVCSSVSQIASQLQAPSSPLKEKHVTKSRRQDATRRVAAMRRRRETVKRDTLTMYDLIFYNPTSNPIVPDEDEMKAKEVNEKQLEQTGSIADTEDNVGDTSTTDSAPVPQIKLGPNGEIILDESSLVIKQSEKRRLSTSVVVEGAWSNLGRGRYKRGPRTADWSDAETVRFYRALAALGTDFSLMESLFPGRTRKDLKLKFKKEERLNAAQVDKALRTSSRWDATKLEEEFKEEREAAARREKAEAEREKQRAKEQRERIQLAKSLRMRPSKASKALEASTLPNANHAMDDGGLTADAFIRRHLEAKAEARIIRNKRKPRQQKQEIPPAQPIPIAPAPSPIPQYAQLTLVNNATQDRKTPNTDEMATILKLDAPKSGSRTPDILNSNTVPSDIESGSLVVLTVNDPKSPSKKMLQTYIAHGGGKLTPVALPPVLLNSVVSYMKKGTPRSTVSGASSPSSVVSQDSRSTTPGVIIPSPAKRQRHSSYTITQL